MLAESKIAKKGLLLDLKDNSSLYEITINQHVVLFENESNNIINMKVQKSFIKKDNYGYLFRIDILKREQSNTNETRGLEHDFAQLQKKILIYTNETGRIKSIANIGEIRELWFDIKPSIRKKYSDLHDINKMLDNMDLLMNSKIGYLNLFKQSEIGTLLFPPIYSKKFTPSHNINKYKFYNNFFGPCFLPIKVTSELLTPIIKDQKIKVSRNGVIEFQLLEADRIKKYFKEINNAFVFIESFNLDYQELFDLNEDCNIENGIQLFYLTVDEDIYTFDQKVLIKKIND